MSNWITRNFNIMIGALSQKKVWLPMVIVAAVLIILLPIIGGTGTGLPLIGSYKGWLKLKGYKRLLIFGIIFACIICSVWIISVGTLGTGIALATAEKEEQHK